MSIKITKRGGGLLRKIEHYSKQFGGKKITVKAGWDSRTRNAKGNFPCVYMKDNEFGTRNIPPRPFMRKTIQENQATWQRMLKKGMQSEMDPVILFNGIGSRMRSDIQASIISNVPPPNSPAVAKAKGKRGNNGGTLRDTLFAYQQVTYTVEE